MKKIPLSLRQLAVVSCLTVTPLCLTVHAEPSTSTGWAWSQQPWSDSDTAYMNSQSQIAGLWDAKTMSLDELAGYKKLSQAYPHYSIMLFRWGYYTYCYSLLDPKSAAPEIKKVAQALESHPTPNSYYYARLRYLIAKAAGEKSDPALGQLGARLLRRNPGDDRVKGYQAGM